MIGPITGEESEESTRFSKRTACSPLTKWRAITWTTLRARDDGPVIWIFVDFSRRAGHCGDEADIRYAGDRVFYHRAGDYIQVPPNRFPMSRSFTSPACTQLVDIPLRTTEWEAICRGRVKGQRLLRPICWPSWACLNRRIWLTIKHM